MYPPRGDQFEFPHAKVFTRTHTQFYGLVWRNARLPGILDAISHEEEENTFWSRTSDCHGIQSDERMALPYRVWRPFRDIWRGLKAPRACTLQVCTVGMRGIDAWLTHERHKISVLVTLPTDFRIILGKTKTVLLYTILTSVKAASEPRFNAWGSRTLSMRRVWQIPGC